MGRQRFEVANREDALLNRRALDVTPHSREAGAVTRDTLWGGKLVFWQPARGAGYRFNLDPILLAGFVRPARRILDLGAGCGIIGTLVLAEEKAERVIGVELQERLAELARRNAHENGFDGRLSTQAGDLRSYTAREAFDAVVFNPPYFRVGEGRSAPDLSRESARRERHGTLEDFVRQGLKSLKCAGALYCIVRIDRLEEALQHIARHGGSLRRTRAVCSRRDVRPRHTLLEAIRGGQGPSREEAPLVVHQDSGYSDEVRRLLRGNPHRTAPSTA